MTPKARDYLIFFIVWLVLTLCLFAIVMRADAATGSAVRSAEYEQTISGIIARVALGGVKDVLASEGTVSIRRAIADYAGGSGTSGFGVADVRLTIDGRHVKGIAGVAHAINRVAGYALDSRSGGSVEYVYRLRIRGYDVRRSTRIENDHVVLTTSTGWTEVVPITKRITREVPINVAIRIAATESGGHTRVVGTAYGAADTRQFKCSLVHRFAERMAGEKLSDGLTVALRTIQTGGERFYAAGASDVLDAIHRAVKIGKLVRR